MAVETGRHVKFNKTECETTVMENCASDSRYFNQTICRSLCDLPWTFPDNSKDSSLRSKGLIVGKKVCYRWKTISVCVTVNVMIPCVDKDCLLSGVPVVNTIKGIGGLWDYHWLSGNHAYGFLPPNWAGCCYLAKLTPSMSFIPLTNITNSELSLHHRAKREMAQFDTLDSYHYHINLGGK